MFKLNMKYTVKGREVRAEDFAREFVNAGIEEALGNGKALIESVVCPVHGKRAANVQTKRNGDKVAWTYEKCCDALEQAIVAKFKED